MFAAVDLGSNSFRLHIGVPENDDIRIVRTMREPIRLAAGLDENNCLGEAAIQRAADSLKRFGDVLGEYELDAVRVVATNTLRIATNSADILPIAEKAIGYPIDIISGEEEGRLIYMGVTSALRGAPERKIVVDIGGGSTEVAIGRGVDIEIVESFSIGTVKQSESFFPGGRITANAFDAAILSARGVFEDAAPSYRALPWKQAYGSSGTIRAIAEVIEKNKLGDGKLSVSALDALKAEFIRAGHLDRIKLEAVKSERAVAMVGGLAVLMGLMHELGIESITAVEAGLRMGVLSDLQLRATKHDRREGSVEEFMQRFQVNRDRAEKAAAASTLLHEILKPAANPDHRPYLRWASLLHEVGMIVSHSGYHKHGAYLVLNADLPGFTKNEQQLMSTLLAAQKGSLRKLGDAVADVQLMKAVLALRLAVLFMHARLDVNGGSVRLKMKGRIELVIEQKWLTDHPTLRYWIGKESDHWKEIGIEFSVEMV